MEKLDKQLSLNLRKTPLIESVNLALRDILKQNVQMSIQLKVVSTVFKQDSENSMIRYLIWAILCRVHRNSQRYSRLF